MTILLYIVAFSAWAVWTVLLTALVVETWRGKDFTYGATTGKRESQGLKLHGVLLPACATMSLLAFSAACIKLPAWNGNGTLIDALPRWVLGTLGLSVAFTMLWALWMWLFMWPKFLVPPLARHVRGALVSGF